MPSGLGRRHGYRRLPTRPATYSYTLRRESGAPRSLTPQILLLVTVAHTHIDHNSGCSLPFRLRTSVRLASTRTRRPTAHRHRALRHRAMPCARSLLSSPSARTPALSFLHCARLKLRESGPAGLLSTTSHTHILATHHTAASSHATGARTPLYYNCLPAPSIKPCQPSRPYRPLTTPR